MTQMASGGGMPAPSETEADDLVELRHRLTDRPLQVPELGELKPAKSPRSGKDGWIRF
jgi:type IV secretory pathway ATPase VirB11/archaellum biosynthesis ATPase